MPLLIENVIERLRGDLSEIADSVDRLDYGFPSAEVRGIATVFMPTLHTIEEAVRLGANLLVTHEGLYYSHRKPAEGLMNDPAAAAKHKLIEQNGIAVYRHHDYCHRSSPDIIMTGLLKALQWEPYVEKMLPDAAVLRVPKQQAAEIAGYLKHALRIPYVRMAGDPDSACERIGILVGYRGGGDTAIPLFRKERLDAVIAGEGPEWETPEYVRDSVHQGAAKAYIALGHAESEAPGMACLAEQLQEAFPETPVHFIADKQALQLI